MDVKMSSESADRACGGADAPGGGRRRLAARLFVGAVVMAGLWLVGRALWPPPAIPPAAPENLERLEPQLRDYIREKLAWAGQAPRSAERHGKLGLIYAANGLWKAARSEFLNVLRIDPRHALAKLYLAVSERELGDQDASLSHFQELVKEHPDFAPGFYRLGEALLQRGDLEGAEKAFERLVILAPDEWRGYAGLGEIRLRQGKIREAAGFLERALTKDPSAKPAHHLLGTAYQRLGRTNEALYEFRLARDNAAYPMEDAWSREAPLHMKRRQDIVDMANEYIRAGAPSKAVKILAEALKYDTNNVSLLTNLGVAYTRAGMPEEGLRYIRRALSLKPKHVPALLAAGQACLAKEDPDEAIRMAEQAAAAATNLVQPYILMANAWLAKTNDAEAIRALRKAAEASPSDGRLLLDIGDIQLWNLRQPREALASYRAALKRDPLLIPVYLRLAQLSLMSGKTNEALAQIRKARRFVPGDPALAEWERRLTRSGNQPPVTPEQGRAAQGSASHADHDKPRTP